MVVGGQGESEAGRHEGALERERRRGEGAKETCIGHPCGIWAAIVTSNRCHFGRWEWAGALSRPFEVDGGIQLTD